MKYSLTTDFEDDDFHLAHAGPFVFMNWRGAYKAANFPRIESVHHRLAERRKEDITGVSIVEAALPIPGEDVRLAGADMMTRTHETTKAVVIIFLDQGFAASALQSVAARELSLGGRVPMKFFHDLPSAAKWLAQVYPKLEMTPLDMEQLLQKLRVKFAPSRRAPASSSSELGRSSDPSTLSSFPPGRRNSSTPPASAVDSRPASSRHTPISSIRGIGSSPRASAETTPSKIKPRS